MNKVEELPGNGEEESKPCPYDLVIVMGAKLERNEEDALYYPKFEEFRDGKLVDGDLRARAIAEIHKQKLSPLVVVTGGYEDGTSTLRSRALFDYAHKEYGVPKTFLYPLQSKPNSLGNIDAAAEFLKMITKSKPIRSVAFLTNLFHVPRAAIFVANHPFFKNSPIDLHAISAERILLESGKLNPEDLYEYYQTPHIQERVRMEEKGIQDFRNGVYVSGSGYPTSVT